MAGDFTQPHIIPEYIPPFNPDGQPDHIDNSGGGQLAPLSQTFELHSNPGAALVIYLDFDGHITQNTPWNNLDPMDPVPTIVTPPYSVDGNGSFTNLELLNIQEIFERTAEDFRPFDVDVTTEDPGTSVIGSSGIRVAIGGDSQDWLGVSAGGVAFIGSFAAGDIPCFVFDEGTGNGDPKATTEAVSHEVGHTLGLFHYGQVVLGNDPDIEYYEGHGPGLGFPTGWAPLMGVGYYQELSQWSKGEYPNAKVGWPEVDPPIDPLLLQDDLAIISSTMPYRADDHGATVASATELDFTGVSYFGDGIIEKNTDVDWFSFDLSVEEVTFNISPAELGPNLDILAKLYDSGGNLLASSNPLDELTATFAINTSDGNLQLNPGKYHISVEGTGKPPTTDPGYSKYASLGYYTVSAARETHLDHLVGIDFDISTGVSPNNWTLYSGGSNLATFSDMENEIGESTEINLTISSTNPTITSFPSTVDPTTVPLHPQVLDEVGGYISDTGATWTFTWSDLDPLTVYEIYVFGHADQSIENVVRYHRRQQRDDQLYPDGGDQPVVDQQ